MENKINLNSNSTDLSAIAAEENAKRGVEIHNQSIDKLTQEYLDRVNSNTKEIDGLELFPGIGHIIIKPYGYNPYAKLSVEGGLLVGGDLESSYKSNETGQTETETKGIHVAQVIEVGFGCKFCKPGDDVYVSSLGGPLPFFNQGFYVTNEFNVMAVANIGLTKRLEEIQEKTK